MSIVINLIGQPGGGKSTGMAYIFSQLKLKGISCEQADEYIKSKIWEGHDHISEYQIYVFAKQLKKLQSLNNKVDVIVTDSPLFLQMYYGEHEGENFKKLVMEKFNSFTNKNYFINRVKKYDPKGRYQTEEESDIISKKLKSLLNEYNIDYKIVNGDIEGYNTIINEIIELI